MTKKYEVMVILKPLLPDDIRRGTIKKIEKTITDNKGKIINSEVWGKRHLAYDIKGHVDGYYILWGIDLDSIKVHELEKNFHLVSDVLRFIVLQVDKFELKEIK